ncbi:MAG: hypothetical protein PHQ35_02455 [Phycisphaerae bacterium]|nr:hypothetical protein [Phycisphaerae bacterium]MDD5380507.1 hypothetical protein [Phycisphaerae bacterium]
MVKKINYGKILVVIFITILIWVWADLALDEVFSVPSVVITAKSTNPGLWVSFGDKPSVSIDKMVLKGPASKVAEVRRKLKDGLLVLEFLLDPAQTETIAGPGEHTLPLLTFLRQSEQIKKLGLTVESCEPQSLSVRVVELDKKLLTVKCIDETQNTIKAAIIDPKQVDAFVPKGWSGEKLVATVQLTRRELDQTKLSAVEKAPFFELAPGQIRWLQKTVKITMPPEEDLLTDYTITTARLRFSISPNIQGKYRVIVDNLDEVIRTITIRAAPDAKRAYEKMPYQVTLQIDDEDAASAEPLRRNLIYNFPDEYLRRDEIRLNQQPVTARFKLIPITASETPPGAGNINEAP